MNFVGHIMRKVNVCDHLPKGHKMLYVLHVKTILNVDLVHPNCAILPFSSFEVFWRNIFWSKAIKPRRGSKFYISSIPQSNSRHEELPITLIERVSKDSPNRRIIYPLNPLPS
jgi:hypothetical protein